MLILEIVVGVAAGIVLGFFILANWASIVDGIERAVGVGMLIALAAGLSYGLAWGIDVLRGTTPTAQELNTAAGNVMGGLLAVGVLIYLSFNLVRSIRNLHRFARDRLNRRRGA